MHLIYWDETLGLGAYIDNDTIAANADDCSFDYLTTPERANLASLLHLKKSRHVHERIVDYSPTPLSPLLVGVIHQTLFLR